MPEKAELLKEVHLFNLLDDTARAELAGHLEVVRYGAGEVIFNQGDPGDAVYVISSGTAEVFIRNATGERIVLEAAKRGDFLGELSVLAQGGRSASVMTVEDTEAFRLDREALERFVIRNPNTAMDMLASMAKRLKVSADRLRSTATRNVNEEVADRRTVVQKSADWIAEFAGSITFLVIHIIWFGSWLLLNIIPGIPRFDPFPFGFLTLTVSLEAIFLSVFVLLSQNRQAAKERVRSDVEYDVNLKAELEICHLHEKMDKLNAEVLARLEKLQRASEKR